MRSFVGFALLGITIGAVLGVACATELKVEDAVREGIADYVEGVNAVDARVNDRSNCGQPQYVQVMEEHGSLGAFRYEIASIETEPGTHVVGNGMFTFAAGRKAAVVRGAGYVGETPVAELVVEQIMGEVGWIWVDDDDDGFWRALECA